MSLGAVLVLGGCTMDQLLGVSDTAAACSPSLATNISLNVGAYTSVDPLAGSNCSELPANTSSDSAEYLLVPWSVTGVTDISAPFQLRGGGTQLTARADERVAGTGTRSAAVAFDQMLRRMGRSGNYPRGNTNLAAKRAPAATAVTAPPAPGDLRTFIVCANQDCSSTTNVGARAQAVGQHVAIYVDETAPSGGLNSQDLDTLRQEFDTRLYPVDTTNFGGVSDIDNNSVVIVLMTGAVNKLVSKADCDSAGFVAGFFFSGDLDPAAGGAFNNGEIFYTIVADPNATLSCSHTRSEVKDVSPASFVHEFQHMINFVEHVLVRNGEPEEGWLDEGLSKYAEELLGQSYLDQALPDSTAFSNNVIEDLYTGYKYLQKTGSFPLLIPEDNGTLEEIGASWLFTRFVVDQFGPGIAKKLVQTGLAGSANVAAQTGQSFATVLTHWSLANWVSGLPNFNPPAELRYTTWNFRRTFASLNANDRQDFPVPYPLVPAASAANGVMLSGSLHSGSGTYQRALQGPGGSAITLLFTANGTTPISTAIAPRLNIIRIR